MDLIDMTGTDGEAGWFVVVEPHRCSRKFCPNPAVIFYTSKTYGYRQPRYWRRRFACAEHMNEYNAGHEWWVADGRIMRERYEWEPIE